MPVHRLRQAEERLRGPGLGEALAVVLQVGFHPLVGHTGGVGKPAPEFLLGAIGRERETARQRQALGFIATPLAEPHDPPLQVAQADRHRVAPGGRADHDQAPYTSRKAGSKRQRNHPAVRRAHRGVEGLDSDLLARGDDGRRLVNRGDRWEQPALRRGRGLAPAPQPVEAKDLEPLGVEGPPGTDLPLPPPFRIGPAGHVAPCRNAAQYDDGSPAWSTEPPKTDRAGIEPLPAGECQPLLKPDLMRAAGKRAHALTGRSRPGSPGPTTVPADWLSGAR